MILKRFLIGPAQNNTVLYEHNNEVYLIDCPAPIDKIVNYVRENNIKIKACLLTHTHWDHIAGLNDLKLFDCEIEVYVVKSERYYLRDYEQNLSKFTDQKISYDGEYKYVDDLEIEGMDIKYISGHSKKSCVFIFEADKTIFAGDSLFREAVGRSDFYHGNHETLISGIKSELMVYPDDFKVYPGHGFATTIGNERQNNEYLK